MSGSDQKSFNAGSSRISVLITSYNRRDLTLRCLKSIFNSSSGNVEIEVYLVIDGSDDGTAERVRMLFPQVRIISGSGNLYWNGGMMLAWQCAIGRHTDFYLWLNDDTELKLNAIEKLILSYRSNEKCSPKTIVVGRTVSVDGRTTYGGYVRNSRLSRLSFRHLRDDETSCVTFNGNCVLIPACATDDIGLLCGGFTHAFGDNDYGLRATRAGYRIIEMKEPVAEQEANRLYSKSGRTLTLSNWRHVLFDPKGVPVVEWCRFCARHGGPLWPANFVFRYVKMFVRGLKE